MSSIHAGRLVAPLAMLLVLGGANAARADADDAAAKPVKLASEVQQKLGLRSEPLKAKAAAASLSGFIKVLDPGPLAQLDSDIDAALALSGSDLRPSLAWTSLGSFTGLTASSSVSAPAAPGRPRGSSISSGAARRPAGLSVMNDLYLGLCYRRSAGWSPVGAASAKSVRFHQPPPSDWNRAAVSARRAARA